MLGPSDHLAAPLEITHVLPLAPPSPCAPRYEVWRRRVLGGPRVGRRLRAFIASTVVPVALALWFAHNGFDVEKTKGQVKSAARHVRASVGGAFGGGKRGGDGGSSGAQAKGGKERGVAPAAAPPPPEPAPLVVVVEPPPPPPQKKGWFGF
ncbi:hypothetical protein MNEG_15302 [Monoraphidium neglectum]|uniref:Uncharacterized protein n=1 Tax=Monoraphidium neglectum TaxID=145388 RepID=A0A0D2MBG3_9CHLO|nr:hypothetical protein MNEG_15302 [Monoraphidium neglectum]KIY92660.1 hypothetical protein MNEG_15302 [Monoraphidium neglectum]|eukprot:XP_013891680.1 hypothetical protein MNEG_15302 [Monoraphidium neglectum]